MITMINDNEMMIMMMTMITMITMINDDDDDDDDNDDENVIRFKINTWHTCSSKRNRRQ